MSLSSSIDLSIGGVSLRAFTRDPDVTLCTSAMSQPFLAPASPRPIDADIAIDVSFADLSAPPQGKKLFDTNAVWAMYEEGDALSFRFTSPHFGPHPYKTATFDRGLARGALRVHRPYFPEGRVTPFEFPLDEVIVSQWLAERSLGVILHAAGVVDRDLGGYIFMGDSGVGKSTTARLWAADAGVTVLSDERIVVREVGGEFVMFGTPWPSDGGFGSPRSAPLRAIYLLQHGRANEIRPVASGAALAARLFSNMFPPFHSRAGLENATGVLQRLLSRVRCFDFPFVPDAGAVEFVRAHERAQGLPSAP